MNLDLAHVKPDFINFLILSAFIFLIIGFWKFADAQFKFPPPIHTLIAGA